MKQDPFNYKGIFFEAFLGGIGWKETKYKKAQQAYRILTKFAKKAMMTMADIESLIEQDYESIKFFADNYSRCPKCGGQLGIEKVNNHPAMMVGEDFTHRVFCRHFDLLECEFEYFVRNFTDPMTDDSTPYNSIEYTYKKKPCGGCGGK